MTTPAAARRPWGMPSEHLFHDFVFQSTLGEGQYGSVWRCVDRRTGEGYACKQMDKRKHPKSVDRETVCFARVQAHPHIVRMAQLFEDDDHIYILMELCAGGDLLPVICQSGGLEETEACAIFRQLASAVAHCHERGVIHRDIKPENVLLDQGPDGTPLVKLADFGLSTTVKRGKKVQGWVGSPPYEAPEVIDLKPYDASADIWSLGVVLYGMLSANWPSFLAGRKFNKKVDFMAPVWQGVSPEAKSLITRMLCCEPALRPTAHEVLQDAWIASRLELGPADMSMELEGPSPVAPAALPVDFIPSITEQRAAAAKLRPVDFLPPLSQQAQLVTDARPDLAEPMAAPAEKVRQTDGSFTNWLGEGGAGTAGWRADGGKEQAQAEIEAEQSGLWNRVALSRTPSSSGIPEAAPCSDSSASSSPGSPNSTPSESFSSPRQEDSSRTSAPGKQSPSEKQGPRKQFGKRLLELVSSTLTVSPMCVGPMCVKLAPSNSPGSSDGTHFKQEDEEQESMHPRAMAVY